MFVVTVVVINELLICSVDLTLVNIPLTVEGLGNLLELLPIQLLIYFSAVLSNTSKTDSLVDTQVNEFVRHYSQFLEGKSLNTGSWESLHDPAHTGLFRLLNFFVYDVNYYLIVNILERLKAFLNSLTFLRLLLDFVTERITSRDELPLEVLGKGAGILETGTAGRSQEKYSPHWVLL